MLIVYVYRGWVVLNWSILYPLCVGWFYHTMGEEEHRKMVTNQLQKRYNFFHYDLHKIYLWYGTHTTILAGATLLVTEAWSLR